MSTSLIPVPKPNPIPIDPVKIPRTRKKLITAAAKIAAQVGMEKAMEVAMEFLNPTDPPTPIANLPTQDIVQNFHVVSKVPPNIEGAAAAQSALDELIARGQAAVDALTAKLEADDLGKPRDSLNERLGNLYETALELPKRICPEDELEPNRLNKPATDNFNKAQRRDTDGVFVSREYPEFLYCLN